MTTIHRVSSCCGGLIRKFGGRRRQCSSCNRTWRVHPHRAGRKWRRVSGALAARVLDRGSPVSHAIMRRTTLTTRALQYRVNRAIKVSAERPRILAPLRGTYSLIGDGVWYTFGGADWVLYLLLLKPRRRNYAILLDPILLPGRETFQNWKVAVESMPEYIRDRISSFVSDHFSSSEKLVRTFGWIHQLCHFHLIAELQKRRGRYKTRLAGASVREDIYQCIVHLLTRDDAEIVRRLRKLIRHPDCPRKVGMIAREFMRVRDRYRTYLRYPALTIPKTTGAAESLGKLIRKRTWSLRDPTSVLRWATAFIRLKKNMTCNGTHATLKKSTKLIS